MLFPREQIREFVTDNGEPFERLEAVCSMLIRLDAEFASNPEMVSPCILLEPFEPSAGSRFLPQFVVTGDAANQFFLEKGYAQAQATTEELATVGRVAVHQLRIRSLKDPVQIELERCGCPVIPLGASLIDPMSFIMLGQMQATDLAEHFSGYRMGVRRAKRIKEMATRLVDDLLDE